jgi:hypothetical protein
MMAVTVGLFPMLAFAGDVKTFPKPGVDLSAFKTFKMLPTRILTSAGVVENDPDISPLLIAAIKKELTGKGLVEVAEGADLEVAAGGLVVASAQLTLIIYNLSLDDASPIGTMGRINREGTLIVNLIDPRVKKSVWVGFATRGLGGPSSREKDINKAAQALFKKYPALK